MLHCTEILKIYVEIFILLQKHITKFLMLLWYQDHLKLSLCAILSKNGYFKQHVVTMFPNATSSVLHWSLSFLFPRRKKNRFFQRSLTSNQRCSNQTARDGNVVMCFPFITPPHPPHKKKKQHIFKCIKMQNFHHFQSINESTISIEMPDRCISGLN